jgi:prepilin-type N-terminal cleavage/methylation domain-containing protein
MGRRRERFDEDRGFTLIELLIAMSILGVLLTLVMVGAITALRSSTGVNVRSLNANTSAAGLDRLTKELREAISLNQDATSPFTAASASGVTFASEFGTIASGAAGVSKGPTVVQISLGTTANSCPSPDYCLLETDTPSALGKAADGSAAWVSGSVSTTHVIIHGVSPTPVKQLFSYYSTTQTPTGNPAAPLLTVSPIALDGSGAVASADLPSITTVDVFLAVQDPSSPSAPSTSVESRVYMPNTSTYAVPAATS